MLSFIGEKMKILVILLFSSLLTLPAFGAFHKDKSSKDCPLRSDVPLFGEKDIKARAKKITTSEAKGTFSKGHNSTRVRAIREN